VIGGIGRECLDYLIPLNERHLKRILREFITHYNRGRPHSALASGFPEPIQTTVPVAIDIDCRRSTVLHRRRCSVAYIMNIAWSRMLDNGLEYFRITGVYPSIAAMRLTCLSCLEIGGISIFICRSRTRAASLEAPLESVCPRSQPQTCR